jgi:hypothetical protein
MTVRRATIDDLAQLVKLAQLEHARSTFSGLMFDRPYVAQSMGSCIRGMSSAVFIAESGLGFIAGIVQPKLFSKYMSAYELAWYSEDASGLALLRAFTDWAQKMCAVDLIVSNYAGIKSAERFTRVMQRSGFSVLGTSYTRQLL